MPSALASSLAAALTTLIRAKLWLFAPSICFTQFEHNQITRCPDRVMAIADPHCLPGAFANALRT